MGIFTEGNIIHNKAYVVRISLLSSLPTSLPISTPSSVPSSSAPLPSPQNVTLPGPADPIVPEHSCSNEFLNAWNEEIHTI